MPEALFELTRFQLKKAALTPGLAERIDDAYVFAWDVGVFPVFHEAERLHEPFSAHFGVSARRMQELMTFLDEGWLSNEAVTFYALERTIGSNSSEDTWTRSALVDAIRYAFLSRRFDSGLYGALLSPGDHPLEADVINRPYDRQFDISLP